MDDIKEVNRDDHDKEGEEEEEKCIQGIFKLKMSDIEEANSDDPGKEEKWINSYSSSHKILLVGEGDFAFALCLARAFDSAVNIVATSLDSEEMLERKYNWTVKTNLQELECFGCTIIHGVDAHTMRHHRLLNRKLFDRIVFNFPHTRLKNGEANSSQILRHQRLVKGFFSNAKEMLTKNGEAHVTHKACYPYSEWKIEKLATEVGLFLVEKERLHICDYPGYENKKGSGCVDADKTFHVGESYTYKFATSES